MLNKMKKSTQAELSMLVVAFIWGTTFLMTKNALSDIGPFLFLGIRFIIAFLLLALLSFKSLKNIDRSTILSGSIIGFFLFIGYIFQTAGLQYTTSSNAGFITGLNVVIVPLIYSIIKHKLPAISTLFTILLATAGMYFISVQPGTFKLAYGDLLILVCAFAFAMHIISVDQLSHKHNAVAITAVQILFVGLTCLIIGVFVEPIPETFSRDVIGAILVTSLFATTFAFLIQNYMQKFSTPTRFAIILAMEPVFAGITGYCWGGDILTLRTITGMILILTAMLFAILLKKD